MEGQNRVITAESKKEFEVNAEDFNKGWAEKIELVKAITAKNCNDTEFALLGHMAKQYGLDPLKKEIWAVKYGSSPANIMVGRDGYLTIAHKSGQFNGMKTTYRDEDESATCIVYRKDMENPIECTVYLTEFKSSHNPIWTSKPKVMLQKVAESFALRRAFNVSGVYSPEEFDQAKAEQKQKEQSEQSVDNEQGDKDEKSKKGTESVSGNPKV